MKQTRSTRVRVGPATGLKAVILAGGKGVRLRPFTASFPKPLVPLGDQPVLEVLIRRLIGFGIRDITLTLGHLSELIVAYFRSHQRLSREVRLRYVREEAPTGTAGSLAQVPGLKRSFLVMNGDLLTDLDLHALVRFHRQQKAALTIATHGRHVKIDFGVLEFGPDQVIRSYVEKPEHTYQVSMGVYLYEPRVLKYIVPGRYLDFPELVLRLLKAGERVCAFSSDCLWLDIGRPEDYARAQELYEEKRGDFDYV